MDAASYGFDVEDTDGEPQARQRDRFFDPWRAPRSKSAHDFVQDIIARVEQQEAAQGARARRRRPADQATFEATVAALASNLAVTAAMGAEHEGFVVSRSNVFLQRASRYRAPAENRTFPRLLDALDEPGLGLLRQNLGVRVGSYGQRTGVRPSERLAELVDRYELTLDDFGTSGQETIELRAGKTDAERRQDRPGRLLTYTDTAETRAMRAEMARINAALFSADLTLDDAGLREGAVVDRSRRQLRRMFTEGRFECGGRLFGGFWQGLSTPERLAALTIGDEPVAELDYGQISLRILYGRLGVSMPEGDLYLLPGLGRWRVGIKKYLNALLFDTTERTRKPRNTTTLLPKDVSARELTALLAARLPGIASQFGSGVGHTLQRTESDILVEVLLRLVDHDVVGLPIHDAVLIPTSKVSLSKEIMLEVFRRKVGQEAVVTEERM